MWDALAHSRKDEVNVTASKNEECLGLLPIFVAVSHASDVRAKMGGLHHAGVQGPTCQGLQEKRSTSQTMSIGTSVAVRWSVGPTCGQTIPSGRFLSKFCTHSVANSISRAWQWRCLALQSKRVGKAYQHIIFGSDTDPPYMSASLGGEVAVLQRVGEKPTEAPVVWVAPPAQETASSSGGLACWS